MKKYIVVVDTNRLTRVQVEAESQDDALDLVARGEFEEEQILSINESYTEVRISS